MKMEINEEEIKKYEKNIKKATEYLEEFEKKYAVLNPKESFIVREKGKSTVGKFSRFRMSDDHIRGFRRVEIIKEEDGENYGGNKRYVNLSEATDNQKVEIIGKLDLILLKIIEICEEKNKKLEEGFKNI